MTDSYGPYGMNCKQLRDIDTVALYWPVGWLENHK